MLLRLYRLSDKLGIIILKLAAAIADWLLDSVSMLTGILGRGTGGIFQVLKNLVLAIVAGFVFIFKGFSKILMMILGLFGGAANKAMQVSGSAVSEAMARRAARDEIDVVIKEDPLRVQNRRLSFLVLFLGVIVVAVLLYATDPSRNNEAQPIAVVPANNDNANTAPQTTVEANENANIVPATPIPVATSLPNALRARGAIAYTVRERGQTDIWALEVGAANPFRLIASPADDRDPAWNTAGTRLAYASRVSGNWDIYVYDLLQDTTSPLTVALSFQANPTWSPDDVFIAYENYLGDNLEIMVSPIDGSSETFNLTNNPAPDFSPAWSPQADGGRNIAFVSLREGNQDIYLFNLDSQETTNITNTPLMNEDYPAWSPDGRFIAYSAYEGGVEKVFIRSVTDLSAESIALAVGRSPTWSPDGTSISFMVDSLDGRRSEMFAVTVGDGSLPVLLSSVLPNSANPSWTEQPLPRPIVNRGSLPLAVETLYNESTDLFNGETYRLQSLGNVQTSQPNLSDTVNDSFNALRQEIAEQAAYDYLASLDDAFWELERLPDFGEPQRSWLRTGRAFALTRNGIQGFPPPIEIIREDIGSDVYWRVFVRVNENSQSGQLGEPLRRLPWDFLAATNGNNVEAYNRGGAYRTETPVGYYIDFTQIAADYGWQRQAAGGEWIRTANVRNYWLFVKADGLDWCEAMLEIYPEGQLVNYGCTN